MTPATHSLKLGDRVETNYTGKVTAHTIIAMQPMMNCQGGVGVRVDPPLRTWKDHSNPFDKWPKEFYSIAWFWPVEKDLFTQEQIP